MTIDINEEKMLNTPVADSVTIFFCPHLYCKQPHIMLLDEKREPIAQFVVGDDVFAGLAKLMNSRKK